MALITVPKVLREKLGDDGSDALINEAGNGYKADTVELVEECFDRRLIFWIGQVGALLGILFAFFQR